VAPERWRQIERLYHEALAVARERRSAYVREACGGDEFLLREVEGLLAEASEAEGFIEVPALQLAAEQTGIAWASGQSPRALTAGDRLGSYEIVKSLGAGGMGEVYLAHDPALDRAVAIKLLPSHLGDDPVARERLRREALAAAALDNPFICKVYQIDEQDGRLFCVMEYVRGETLYERMHTAPLERAEALRIAGEVAEAIEEAHAKMFVHRDLKPANVMITPQGRVKVMDFGLAKRLEATEVPHADIESPLTARGVAIGTPDYMSPEQARGGPLDHRSDLFSFGILLSEMLIQTHPFRRANTAETTAALLRDPPSLAMTGSAEMPVGLLLLLRRLLAKSPDERYQSIAEVRRDLARLTAAIPSGTELPDQEAAPLIPLIGRDRERADLVRALDAALGGRGSIVLIGGEAGVGKTHLTRAILAEAKRRGCLTLVGHCSEMEGAPPFVPFIEMLEYSARAAPHESFRYAIGDSAPEVAKLMPELRSMYSDIPPPIELPPEQQRRFLFNACRDFVARSAHVAPMVAVFEDLHWADAPTLLLLQHLSQIVTTSPILMIGTYRDTDLNVSEPLAWTLENLVRRELAVRISLRQLAAEEVGAMLEALGGQAPPPSVVRIVFEETEGNPYFVEEVFRHLAEEGKLLDEKGAWRTGLRPSELQVPQSVRLVIGRRLERLSEEARGVMTVAAVIGRSFSLAWLERLVGSRPDAALAVIEAAERAHLVVAERTAAEARYCFVHELVRQTLAETLSRPRRQRLHARVAEMIEQYYSGNIDSQASALAHHLFQAGSAADPEKTIDWLARAARQASASTAYEDALACLDNALLLAEGERTTRVAELHAQRATVLRSLGHPLEALGAYELALSEFAANGDVGRFAETSIPLVLIYNWSVRLAEGRAMASRALDMLGPEASPRRIVLLCLNALCAACYRDTDIAVALVEEIRQIVGTLGDGPLAGMIWQLRTHTEWHSARLALAAEAGREAARILRPSGDIWGEVDVSAMRACASVLAGHLEEGEALALQTVPQAERVGHWGCLWMCKSVFAEASLARGDLEGADRLVREALELGESAQIGWNFVGEAELANIARTRGLVTESLERSRRALAAEPARNSYTGYPQASLALTLAQARDPRALSSVRAALRDIPVAGRRAPLGAWQSLVLVIEGLATIGRLDEVAALHPVAEDLATTGIELAFTVTLPRTAAGIAAACAGNWERAEQQHRAAMRLADAIPHRVAQAIARYWYAEMLRARGDSADKARGLLDEAATMFDALGMPLYAGQARQRRAAQAGS
jgi:tetratricopeptide (TPR) repeat protein